MITSEQHHLTHKSYRDIVQDMPESERVPYLLDCLDVLHRVAPEKVERFDGLGIKPYPMRVLRALAKHERWTLSRGAIMDAVYFDRPGGDDLPLEKIVDIYVCHIREKLPASIGTIETVWGRGYRFVPATEDV